MHLTSLSRLLPRKPRVSFLRHHSTSTPAQTPAAAQLASPIYKQTSDSEPDEAVRLVFDTPYYHYTTTSSLGLGGATRPTGIFGRPLLSTPQGFHAAADRALRRSQLI